MVLATTDVAIGALQRRPLEIRRAARCLQRLVDDLDRLADDAALGDQNRVDQIIVQRNTAFIAAVIDAWWPAAFNRLTALRPMATIAFTLDIMGNLDGLDPEAPLLHCATSPVCADGYFLETRELWGEDGRLVAINHQTFAIIQ